MKERKKGRNLGKVLVIKDEVDSEGGTWTVSNRIEHGSVGDTQTDRRTNKQRKGGMSYEGGGGAGGGLKDENRKQEQEQEMTRTSSF